MNISDFFSRFPDNESCKSFFKKRREEKGIVCRRCGGIRHYWLDSLNKWECADCKYRTGLKCGTIMEDSNLDYRIWLWSLYLITLTKKGFSALEMQRLLGHKRYEPVWLLMHKIRVSMGTRDSGYSLDGFVEMDEGFFAGHRKNADQGKDLANQQAPQKELDRQVRVIVGVSSEDVEPEKFKKYRPRTKARYLKMETVDSLSSGDIGYAAESMTAQGAIVKTDGKRAYRVLKKLVNEHIVEIIKDKSKVIEAFPWVHIAISNARKKILGLHHHVKNEYMQNYLNEFCYKFNRRYFGSALFDRMLVTALDGAWNRVPV